MADEERLDISGYVNKYGDVTAPAFYGLSMNAIILKVEELGTGFEIHYQEDQKDHHVTVIVGHTLEEFAEVVREEQDGRSPRSEQTE